MTFDDLFKYEHRNTRLTLGVIFFGLFILVFLSGGIDLSKGGVAGYFTEWFGIVLCVLGFFGFILLVHWFGTRHDPPPKKPWMPDDFPENDL